MSVWQYNLTSTTTKTIKGLLTPIYQTFFFLLFLRLLLLELLLLLLLELGDLSCTLTTEPCS
mgnify:CR=1 FL=1